LARNIAYAEVVIVAAITVAKSIVNSLRMFLQYTECTQRA
jgi:hypothetical protein